MDQPVVELDGVSRTFGSTVALAGFDLRVPAGSITVLLGPNGAGKTTALRIVTGVVLPQQGRVRTFGMDPSGPDGPRLRARCGVVPARPALYDRFDGRTNLAYAAALHALPAGTRDERIRDAARRFGIEHALAQRVGGYSTGMRARLALARAMLGDPELLLLDEPTAGLDPESAREVLALIRGSANRGAAVIMCTHLLLEADGLADQVVVMDRGRALVTGSPAELVRRYWSVVTVLVDAADPTRLDVAAALPFVRRYERNGTAIVELDDATRIPDLVEALVAAGARLSRVEPRTPTLEELYFTVRRVEP